MLKPYRLPPMEGEWIDRDKSVIFKFEGKPFCGFEGDTMTSALWASGQRFLGRSFKYHRPRGILSLANHDVNVMMQWGQHLNVRADVTALASQMQVNAVNTTGGLEKDQSRIFNHLSSLLPVGFYYKAFHSKKLFPYWERLFRNITGLGKVDLETPRIFTPKDYDFCSVAVIGAGPSGLAAALAAAEQGADTLLIDENPQCGGSGHYQRGGDNALWHATKQLLEKVEAHPLIRVLTSTVAAGYYADHWLALVSERKMTKLRAKSVVFATGAFEQPAVFGNNDLPGVMLGSAAQRLMYRFAVRPAQRAVVLLANDDGYRLALDLKAHGVEVAAMVDMRPEGAAQNPFSKSLTDQGIPLYTGCCVYEALPAKEDHVVGMARVASFSDGKADLATVREIQCDGIIMSVGWAPAANLLYQANTQMRYTDALEQFVPGELAPGIFACGRVNGLYNPDARLRDGQRAGSAAAAYLGFGKALEVDIAPGATCPSFPWPMVSHPQGKNFVDFDEDLQLKDFENAVQEGFDNIELLKRFTTNGMGPSQGKHSNMNALRILGRLTGQRPDAVGTTTARPFFHPIPLSHLAGRGFHPERRTPVHPRHVALNAFFMRAGEWLRPEYYARAGCNRSACIQEEVAAVRASVGLIDVGTLGKLEVFGPQAVELLERVYVSKYANLKVGMTRYAVMCDEAGVVIDDGVIARLAADHFYFTTTTSGAAQIYRELSRLNAMWRLNCGIVNHTGAFSAMNLAGPKSREVLQQLTAIDLSGGSFPYLAVREGRVAGIPARLMRVGFVGEWGYEIHIPAEYGITLWDAILDAGRPFSIRPFGVEAQRVLRLEKGHVIIGQDTDGLTNPYEAGLGWAIKMDKPFFIGKRSLHILSKQPLRQQLVGFQMPQEYTGPPPQESHLIIHAGEIAGRVTSIAYSQAIDAHIGLALVAPDLALSATSFEIRLTNGGFVTAQITSLPFYDPDQMRQKESTCA
ncbi:2Fe-2S iron-sulfur cluster-binding protein [Acidithiobacillus ferrianus]